MIKTNKIMSSKSNEINFIPHFCFICGSKLEECGDGYYQCQRKNCGEVYFSYVSNNISKNQCVMHIKTPFSLK